MKYFIKICISKTNFPPNPSELKENLMYNDAIPPNSSELKEDLMYNDAIPPNSSELKEDLMYNDASPPNSSELKEDFMYDDAIPPNSSEPIEDFMNNDASPDSYISTNPEPSIKYAAASSSSMQQNYPLKSDDNSTTNICSADKIVPIIRRYFSSPLTFFFYSNEKPINEFSMVSNFPLLNFNQNITQSNEQSISYNQ